MRVTALRNNSNGEESADLRMLDDVLNRASMEPESRHTVAIIRLHGASGNDAENTCRAVARIIHTLEDRLTLAVITPTDLALFMHGWHTERAIVVARLIRAVIQSSVMPKCAYRHVSIALIPATSRELDLESLLERVHAPFPLLEQPGIEIIEVEHA